MKIKGYLLLILAFLPLLYFRDFTPNNELKYLSIADEALRNGNWLTFTNHGIPYADKPPLYFWIIMAGKYLLGSHHMWFLGLFSLLPALLILHILSRWLRPFIDPRDALTAELMLMTTGLFAGSAFVLRMDMLMSLFIFLSLYTFYKIYSRQFRKRDKILLPVYIFLALFTKGPVGILMPFASIVCYLFLQKKLRTFGTYFGFLQWAILLGLCLLWFIGVYAEGGKAYLDNLLFKQTVHRAVDSFHHKEPFWYYLRTIWYSLAPWSLFYITILFIGIRNKLTGGEIEKFFLTVLTVTFFMLSIFSSKLDIYLLPLFPFFTGLAFLLLPRIRVRVLYFTLILPALLLLLAFPASYFLFSRTGLPYPVLLQLTLFLLFAASALALRALYRHNFRQAIHCLSMGILLGLFIGGFALPSLNKHIGFGELCQKAREIAAEHHIHSFCYFNLRSGENMDVYLDQEIQKLEMPEIREFSKKENFILFIRQKDLLRKPELKEIINHQTVYPFTQYDIVIFKKLSQKPSFRLQKSF